VNSDSEPEQAVDPHLDQRARHQRERGWAPWRAHGSQTWTHHPALMPQPTAASAKIALASGAPA